MEVLRIKKPVGLFIYLLVLEGWICGEEPMGKARQRHWAREVQSMLLESVNKPNHAQSWEESV